MKETTMSKHLFGSIVTGYGPAANNRGENDGNITTLQKLFWKDNVHTTVSAEAIRWALRYFWEKTGNDVNRRWDEETYDHDWCDQTWEAWTSKDEELRKQRTYIDDDLLGFMLAEAANTDGNDGLESLKKDKKAIDEQLKALSKEEQKADQGKALKAQSKSLADKVKAMSEGTCDKRRGALEVTRAISLSPFAGDITSNAKSGEKTNTSLYATEVHATRYQYSFALTPELLREQSRVLKTNDAVISLRDVGGNHSRFLFDFSPIQWSFVGQMISLRECSTASTWMEKAKLASPLSSEKSRTETLPQKSCSLADRLFTHLMTRPRPYWLTQLLAMAAPPASKRRQNY
jgi:CRISPR-associated protein Cst2